MALPPRGERLPSEMNEGTDYGYKGHKGPTYGLGALGLLGPSPPARFYSILFYSPKPIDPFHRTVCECGSCHTREVGTPTGS
jgi:hypothetical protein